MRFAGWLRLSCVVAALVVFALAVRASAQQNVGVVSNVKVISDKVEDVTTLEDWKRTYIKPGMTDDQKAIAIWKTVIKYRHQDSPPCEYFVAENVHDPMKTIHVYGYGMCCCAASNIEGLARYLGYPARGRIISAHSVPEIFYGDAWHLLDASVMNYHVKDDGTIASVDDMRAAVRGWFRENPELAKELRGNDAKLREFAKNEGWKKGPPLLSRCPYYGRDGVNAAGWHGWPSTMQEYDWSDQKCAVFDYGPSMGYQVNVQLRPGEKLTRNWSNKGLHVNMPGDAPGIMNTTGPLGLQKQFGDVAPGRVGNGVLEYDVPLATGEFRAGALTAENLVSKRENPNAAAAVAVKDPARPGVLVIRSPSSYVYLKGDATFKAVVGEGGAVTVSFSDNQGLDWKEIRKIDKSGDEKLDLSKLVLRRYDYRLKFEMTGAGTGLDSLVLRHDVQHSQTPLPAVLEGKNTITFTAGPPEGTITYEGSLNPDAAMGKQVAYTDFHPVMNGIDEKNLVRVGGTGKADVTFTLNTPGDMTRIRMNAHYRARDAKDGWVAEASFDDGKTWAQVEEFPGPFVASSRYAIYDKVPPGKRQALLRLSGHQRNTTCMFDLRIDADYKEPMGGFRPVKVTYVWTEGGQEKTDVHVARQPKDVWTITCGPGTVPKSYTVELAQ